MAVVEKTWKCIADLELVLRFQFVWEVIHEKFINETSLTIRATLPPVKKAADTEYSYGR